ncbi:MAG: sel1 repeat family protein [Clostridiales bacterium]|jgi:TPR repeat protein|nr:sel1 repeat family protein [Clostridiales bacterium]
MNTDSHLDIDKLTKLALQGDVDLQLKLAYMYRNGECIEKDYEKAVYWFKQAAEQGHSHAQYNLALRYYNGQGVKKDIKEATLWFAKAADQGHSQALYALGFRYLNGDGVAKNRELAMEIFLKVAEQGFSYAQYNLGKQFYDFLDYKKAVIWLTKACEQNHPQAQSLLANCYRLGRGVDKDEEKAKYWSEKASTFDNKK